MPDAGTTRQLDGDSTRESGVADVLRTAILAGDFAAGQRLVEADLCAQLSASRFVVRAALQELVADGLVEMQRNKGARVRIVPLEEALEIVEVRLALERLSAARAAVRATGTDVRELRDIAAQMRSAVQQAELIAYGRLNARLHATIQRISANATCARMLDRLAGQIVRHQFALSLQPGRPQVSLPQHEQIVAAIADHNPMAADAAMRTHLRSVIEAMRAMPPARLR